MYTVFVKNKPLVFVKNQADISQKTGDFFVKYDNNKNLLNTIDAFEQNDSMLQLYVISPDLETLWQDFNTTHKTIEAAGGLIKNNKEDILFIFRSGKWDLPKGKMEKGESPEESAIREVIEECGLEKVSIISDLLITYHTYKQDNERLLKKTYWFQMLSNDINLSPQTSEGITEVKWVNKKELNKVLKNTYQSILEVVSDEVLHRATPSRHRVHREERKE